jgi:4-hydroxyphenylpyruvate dioxygenase
MTTMADLFDNPMGLMGFEFVEFAAPVAGVLEPLFERLGFSHVATLDSMKQAGVPLMTAPPATYYEMLEGRLPNHGEDVQALQMRGVLLDGVSKDGERRLLLQIFSQTLLGPVFFEFIQRKGDDGFGEGNFKALFESMERDQLRRGVISAD